MWCDLRKLESMVGQRYLTHESDDSRWEQYRRDHRLGEWPLLGFKGVSKSDIFIFNKNRDRTGAR